MLRRFRSFDYRQVSELNGIWDFAFLGDVEPDEVDIQSITYTDRLAVPGCFDATMAYAGKRGLVAYRTVARVADTTPHRLVFDGVHHWGRVFVAGQKLCDHAGGFTRFNVDFTPKKAGEIEIVVLVDNRFKFERSPLHSEYFDWYHFGGLTRGVELHRLGRCWIDALQIVTEDFKRHRLTVKIDFDSVKPAGKTKLVITCNGKRVLSETVDLKKSGRLHRKLELPDAKLWSPGEPNLHLLHVRLGDDDTRERIGIRQVRVEGRQILINGEPVRLLGFNRHEAHPQFGHSVPEQLMVNDVQLLKDMGCNFVRGAHYPQDVRFLDLCDETGLCVWSEPTAWGTPIEHLTNENFIRAHSENTAEMIASAINHPSVIIWGCFNEANTKDIKARPNMKRTVDLIRKLDPTRPVSSAFIHPFEKSTCLDLFDVLAVNHYPGWYHDEIKDIPKWFDEQLVKLAQVGQDDKPFIVSEIGAAALYGCRDWNEARYTEQYQAKLLEEVIRDLFFRRDWICGIGIWQFCDVRTTEKPPLVLGRPRGFNNKGVLDEYRRPKLAYEVVKRLFAELQRQRLSTE